MEHLIACLADLRDVHAAVRAAVADGTLTAVQGYALLAEAVDRLVMPPVPALASLS